jgi:hypothetical protein
VSGQLESGAHNCASSIGLDTQGAPKLAHTVAFTDTFLLRRNLAAAAAERAFSEIIEKLQKVADEAPEADLFHDVRDADSVEATFPKSFRSRCHDLPSVSGHGFFACSQFGPACSLRL